MADSLEQAMFVCQLDARECQEVTDRRLVSKWLHLSLGQNLALWRSPLVPAVFLPFVWLVPGGSSSSGCLGAGFVQMFRLGGMGHGSLTALISSLYRREPKDYEERGSHKNCVARTPVLLQLCLFFLWNITSHINELHLNLPASVGRYSLCQQKRWRETEKYTKMCKCTATQEKKKN